MRFKKNDIVLVTAGKDKGKQGKVLRVFPAEDKVKVEGVNMYARHIKKREGRSGEKVIRERSLPTGNIAILNPDTKKADRIGYLIDKDGKKVRIFKKTKKAVNYV